MGGIYQRKGSGRVSAGSSRSSFHRDTYESPRNLRYAWFNFLQWVIITELFPCFVIYEGDENTVSSCFPRQLRFCMVRTHSMKRIRGILGPCASKWCLVTALNDGQLNSLEAYAAIF